MLRKLFILLLHIRLFCKYVINGSMFLGHVLGECFLICVGLISQANFILQEVSLRSRGLGSELVLVFKMCLKIGISQGIRGDAGTPVSVAIRVSTGAGVKSAYVCVGLGSQELLTGTEC